MCCDVDKVDWIKKKQKNRQLSRETRVTWLGQTGSWSQEETSHKQLRFSSLLGRVVTGVSVASRPGRGGSPAGQSPEEFGVKPVRHFFHSASSGLFSSLSISLRAERVKSLWTLSFRFLRLNWRRAVFHLMSNSSVSSWNPLRLRFFDTRTKETVPQSLCGDQKTSRQTVCRSLFLQNNVKVYFVSVPIDTHFVVTCL